MALGNEHFTTVNHLGPPNHAAMAETTAERDDRVVAVRHRPSPATPGRLHADQRAVLRALAEHLMPVDDRATAHADAVIRYIDYLVANESVGQDIPLTLAEVYRSGCDLVQEHACRVYGRRVQALTAAERDELVWDMLESSMDGFERFSPAYFFHTLRRHIADAMQSGTITPN